MKRKNWEISPTGFLPYRSDSGPVKRTPTPAPSVAITSPASVATSSETWNASDMGLNANDVCEMAIEIRRFSVDATMVIYHFLARLKFRGLSLASGPKQMWRGRQSLG